MVSETALAYSAHVEALEAETRPIQLNINRPNFAEAIKGKRNYASMQSALNDALAAGKIEADAVAKDLRGKLMWYWDQANQTGFGFLFNDLAQIIVKPLDDFKLLVTTRIDGHKRAEAEKVETQRVAIQAQEEAKAKAAQDAQLAAERAKMESEVRAKAAEEAKAQREAEAKQSHETQAAAFAETTLCWKCNHVYSLKAEKCDACGATNANVNPDRAKIEETGFSIEEQRKAAQLASQAKPFKSGSMAVTQPFPATGTIIPKDSRPTRSAIIGCIAAHFGVNESVALDWVLAEFRGDIEFSARKEAA